MRGASDLPPGVRRVLAVGAWIVPAHRRAAWRRQWTAEIEHRRSTTGGDDGLMRFASGSIAHAFWMRRQEMTMRGIGADLRHSVRGFLRRPGPTVLAVVTLAIGIGTATAIFSLAEALLLRPLPLPEADRLVRMYSSDLTRGMERFSVSYPDYVDVRDRSGLFEASAVYRTAERDVSGEADPERVRTAAVESGFFDVLGSSVLLGRSFAPDDHDPANPATAVVNEAFWLGRFGADSALVGREVRLDGVPHTVIGVMAEGQGWPADAHFWTPLQWNGSVPEWADARSNHALQVVARLVPDVPVPAASERVREIARTIYASEGISERERGIEALVVPLGSSAGGEGAGALFATLGAAVFLVLLIACVNASGLLLTRASIRTREFSLRSALGAGRGRLAWMLMGESAFLALLGGVLGTMAAMAAIDRAFRTAPAEIRAGGEIELNAPVLLAALGISLVAAVLAGLAPAFRASRVSVAESLKEGGAQGGQARSRTRLRQALVVTELALSLALLVAAGLTIRGFQRQIATDPGFDAENVLTFTVRLPASRYGDEALVDRFYLDAVERLERHPGVVSAAAASRLPLDAGGMSLYRAFILDGAPEPPEGPEFGALWVEVDPKYFETLGVEPLQGRTFSDQDGADGPLVAVVNRRFQEMISPDDALLGRAIRSFYDENRPRTVVGVVDDIQFNGVARPRRSAVVFVPRSQSVRLEMAFLVRTRDDPSTVITPVRQTMTELDANIALDELRTLREGHAADLAGIRFLTSLFATFGALALVLAVSGVYGLVSFSVAQRVREIGLRMALGATSGGVRAQVLRESASLTALGLGAGSLLAYAAARVLAAGMNGVALMEPSTFLGVALLLALAVLVATWVPATRATRVDPMEALRSE